MEQMGPLEFLKYVCGVEDLIRPHLAESSPVKDTADIVFVFDLSAEEFSATYKPFFEKIIAAMGLAWNEISVFFAGEEPFLSPKTKVCLYFGAHQGTIGWRENQTYPTLYVHSLQEMTQMPELKKQTWNLLKDILSLKK